MHVSAGLGGPGQQEPAHGGHLRGEGAKWLSSFPDVSCHVLVVSMPLTPTEMRSLMPAQLGETLGRCVVCR